MQVMIVIYLMIRLEIILKSLKEISKDKTIIIVSHSESIISIFDKIYRIKDGEING